MTIFHDSCSVMPFTDGEACHNKMLKWRATYIYRNQSTKHIFGPKTCSIRVLLENVHLNIIHSQFVLIFLFKHFSTVTMSHLPWYSWPQNCALLYSRIIKIFSKTCDCQRILLLPTMHKFCCSQVYSQCHKELRESWQKICLNIF